MAGRTFFSHYEDLGARVFAHASKQPFDDPATIQALPKDVPKKLVELLRAATVMDPEARPTVAELARRFQEL
jgi:hypothetical protein